MLRSRKSLNLLLCSRAVLALVIVAVLVISLPIAASAISNPTSISIYSVRVFQNLWSSGDMLFVVEYDVDYGNSTPSEDPGDAFLVSLYDGAALKASRGLSYYGYFVSSLYLTSAEAAGIGLVWGGNYTTKVVGNPSLFVDITEGGNQTTHNLGSNEWVAGTQANSRAYLGTWVIGLAEDLEDGTGVTLLTDSGLLNATGTLWFLEAIPGLSAICPTIFYTSVSYPTEPDHTDTEEYAGNLTAGLTGTRLGNALDGLGGWLGVSGTLIGGVGLLILFFILAGRVFTATGSSQAAIVLSIPFVIIGALLGVLPLALLFVAGVLVILGFGVTFILGRFA